MLFYKLLQSITYINGFSMSCSKLQARLKISLVLVFSVCHLYFLLLVSTVSVELYYN